MAEPILHASATSPTAAQRLAGIWADFTKTFGIYPESNVRVRECLGDLLREIGEAVRESGGSAEEGVPILFFRGGVVVGGKASEIRSGSNLAWLHDRIHRAALAGVAFTAAATEEALCDFTRRLLENFHRRDLDLTYEELWPELLDGLELVDRRFAGRFGVDTDSEPETEELEYVASWGGGAERHLDLSSEQPVVDVLLRDERVASSLEHLRGKLVDARTENEETERVDLLGRLIRQMPPDAMQDYETLVGTVVGVLTTVERRLEGGSAFDDDTMLASNVEFTQLMFLASHTLMGRRDHSIDDVASGLDEQQAEGRQEVAPELRGHAGDEKVEDDLSLLLQDLDALPAPFESVLTESETESRAEQAGVYLHFLIETAGSDVAHAAAEPLARLLREGSDEVLVVLGQYLDTERASPSGEDAEARRAVLIEFLRRAQLGDVLRREGLISRDTLAQSFPFDFGVYLEGVDVDRQEDLEELVALVMRLGSERILAAAEPLVQSEGLFTNDRLAPLYATGSRAVLPFARIALEAGEDAQREEAVTFLKKALRAAPEACLLYIVAQPWKLPPAYLLALTEARQEESASAALHLQIASEICRFVRASADDPALEQRRVYAIKHLSDFLTQEAQKLLERILHARQFLVFPRESRAVREAALDVLARVP